MVAQTAGWVLGYSPEYQITEPAHDHLLYLAGLTGGKSLQEPWESLAHDLSTGRVRRPIWHWLLLATALLLPLDVALRRLVIGRDDVAGPGKGCGRGAWGRAVSAPQGRQPAL